jgi:hypothetical protein
LRQGEALKSTEKNGFTIIDVTPDKMRFTPFLWRPPQPVEDIDTMQPVLTSCRVKHDHVRFLHFSDIPPAPTNVRCRGVKRT